MDLFFRKNGSGQPLIVLHGLFGSGDNWLTISKDFANRTVYLVDQRNHGESPHFSSHNYEVLADDIKAFLDQQGITQADILGHSMGGKAAMRFAQKYPNRVQKLIVADIGVKKYPNKHDIVIKGLEAIDPPTLTKRSEAEARLKPFIGNKAVRQFLLKNLYRSDDGYDLRINLPVLKENMENIHAAIPAEPVFKGSALFINGALSDYITKADWPQIKAIFTDAKLETINETGHWMHAEKPDTFTKILNDFL